MSPRADSWHAAFRHPGSQAAESASERGRGGRAQFALLLVVAAAYFGLAWLGLQTVLEPNAISPMQPAGGFMLGVLLLSERRQWPWLLFAALVTGVAAELVDGRTLAVALGLAGTNCGASLLAALLVGSFLGGPFRLNNLRQVLALALAGGVVSAAATAPLGAGVAALGLGSPYWRTLLLWWVAHGVAMVVIAPVVLALVELAHGELRPSRSRLVEGAIVLAGMTAVALLVFTRSPATHRLLLELPYPAAPFLLWVALRLGTRGVALANLVLAVIIAAATHAGLGPFTDPAFTRTEHLLQMQIFLGIALITPMVVAAIANELRERQRALTASNIRLRRDRESLRAAEERFRGLLEAAPDAMVIVDEAGEIVLANAETEKLFGYLRDELVGQPVEVLVPERLRGDHESHRRGFFAHPVTRPMGAGLDLHVLRKDGREVPVEIRLGPLETEDGRLVSAAIRDITERKQAERMRDEFFALVSHELRTPLTSVVGFLDLARQAEPDGQDERSRYIEVAQRGSRRLERIVSDLLFMVQFEAGMLALEPGAVDLGAVAAEAIEAARPGAEQGRLELRLVAETVPACAGDRGRLAQALDNLLSNAIKYTPPEGIVEVRLRNLGERALIEVTDTGQGIPERDQSRLYERFFRGERPGEQTVAGSGLGLAVVKTIVEAHGGRVSFESEEGIGTTFRLELPLTGVSDTPPVGGAPVAELTP